MVKFLYYDAVDAEALTISQALYLLELSDFYGLRSGRFKALVEQKMQQGIDQHNLVQTLDMAAKLDSQRLKDICIRFAAENFEMFAAEGMATQLHFLEKDLLIEIIKQKAQQS